MKVHMFDHEMGREWTLEPLPKPCPRCGGGDLEAIVDYIAEDEDHIFYVRCKGCGCEGRADYDVGWAVENWNDGKLIAEG